MPIETSQTLLAQISVTTKFHETYLLISCEMISAVHVGVVRMPLHIANRLSGGHIEERNILIGWFMGRIIRFS